MVPILVAQCALTRCLSDLCFKVSVQVVGSPMKQAHREIKGEGRFAKERQKLG